MERRFLQTSTIGPLRIFSDYTQVVIGDQTQKHMVKRIMDITSNYFYNLLKVERLTKLYYPPNTPFKCTCLII